MPLLLATAAVGLHVLFQNRRPAAFARKRKQGTVVRATVYAAVVLKVAVVGTEHGCAQSACEVFYVILAVECGDIAASQAFTATVAEQLLALEVAMLAERTAVTGEELCSAQCTTILAREAVYMEASVQCPNEVTRDISAACRAAPPR